MKVNRSAQGFTYLKNTRNKIANKSMCDANADSTSALSPHMRTHVLIFACAIPHRKQKGDSVSPVTEETRQLILELAEGEPEAQVYFTRLAKTFGEDVIRRFRRVETEGLRAIGLRTRLCDVMDGIPEYLTDGVFETWLQRELGIEDASVHNLWDDFGID